MKKSFAVKALVFSAVMSSLVGCGGGGGGGSTYGTYQSPYISATQFVNALNSYDGAPIYDESMIELYTDETLRSAVYGEDDWFVIYDAKYNEHKAVSLQYVRSIVYYDYYQSNYSTAKEFRTIENSDILSGNTNGDFWGDDYEVVDYNAYSGVYVGRNSGFLYEDETQTTDVNLLAKEKEEKKFIQKAANVSFAYNVSMDTALSLVSLGNKVEKLVSKGDLTSADQASLLGDLERMTGKKLNDVVEATQTSEGKQQVISDIAKKIGTSSQNLESKLLPELFGIK
ncbi:MAG: hypothetical protein COW00_08650 [Bdellovibrio sp. CG12_big_fil_rev_8_21_14_0_65_39_13]|nr:MAG: hypothetical protein COW78_08720 [Bdellovibrio sp. CG22_combo_CG10-13_8_21_14_all_39_27]PIQ59694.1 MAG: hypothetical protein COW00_08650 [Bdellovibrio sp. CG12_big_fil_rev_8_21_14_0_65_39_13]PIR36275.1 MAG: hypothetical protein COV37_04735 [Bdellovibrio sp. CG11_big_fil_rev_8_21_14_0_20_39_38]